MKISEAEAVCGTLGFPSKMPGTAYGIPAANCITGSKLAKVAGSVCSDCYAMKGRYALKGGSVEKSQAKRLGSLSDPGWIGAMVYLLRKAHGLIDGKVHRKIKNAGWHRWHDSGDLQSIAHLCAIVVVCQETPEIRHWLPTREARIVSQFLKNGGEFPSNLTVRVSATMVDGAASARFEQTSTVHKDGQPVGHVCPAPKQDGMCGPCRACWDRGVSNTSYHIH